jgi:hypothetical protein
VRCETPDGVKHASKKEAARWLFLKELEAAGVIRNLRRQTRWPLLVNGVKIGTYIDDFDFVVSATGQFVIQDTKSPWTARLPLYRRSKAHVKAQYGYDIAEVFKPDEPV